MRGGAGRGEGEENAGEEEGEEERYKVGEGMLQILLYTFACK